MLKDKIPQIIEHIKNNSKTIAFNRSVFDVLEGDLLSKVDEALKGRLVSERAYQAARKNIAPVNILSRITDKLSKIYSEPVIRTAENPVDQEIMDFYISELSLDSYMADANRFFNSMKAAAIEPYLDDGAPRIRIIPPHGFLPYSDDPVNPLRPTVFIKIMGNLIPEEDSSIYFLYSRDEFIAIDDNGGTRSEFLEENEGVNPFNILPQTYVNKSRHLMIPIPDYDGLQITVLVAILLTNLNFAIEYQSHSIIYGIDLNVENLEINPNAFWSLESNEEGKAPEIGQIKPEVDVAEITQHILGLVAMWFQTKNVRPGTGQTTGENMSSGVSLMIQEADTTDARKEQVRHFEEVEATFWEKMRVIHNYWASNGMIEERRLFSDGFAPSIRFRPPKPYESVHEVIDRQAKLLDLGLSSKRLALREIYPLKSEEEIESMLEEIEEDGPVFSQGQFDGVAKSEN